MYRSEHATDRRMPVIVELCDNNNISAIFQTNKYIQCIYIAKESQKIAMISLG